MKRKVLLFCVIFSSLLAMGCNDIKQGNVAVTQENTSEEQIIIDSKDTETTDAATSDEAVEEVDDTMKNVEEIAYSEISSNEIEVASEPAASKDEENILCTEDGKIIVDLVMFMGQSNMSGAGGNANYAPKVEKGHGYEFRAISDPTRLYPIEEPFGINENVQGALSDTAYGKKGSMVSAFANTYYEETGVPIVAVSASSGGRDTDFFMSPAVVSDFSERQKRAQVWLESNNYYIRKQYVIWLQGESDALSGITSAHYNQNMDNIIRPLFIGGLQKVFIVTTGRTLSSTEFFNDIIKAQLDMCKTSGYYALATTVLSSISTEYMVDEYHYNQTVLNVVGKEAAQSAAYYTNNTKEKIIYDYKNHENFVPDGFEYDWKEYVVYPIDYNTNGELVRY